MKKNELFTRTSILSVSLLLAASLLPPQGLAKKSSSSSDTTQTDSASDSKTEKKSSKSKSPSKKSSSKKSSKHEEKKEDTSSTTSTTTSTAGIADQKSDEVLHQLDDFYKHLKSFKTRLIQRLTASSDTKTVELLSVVDVGVKQPDLIAMNLRAGMPGGSMVSDGTKAYFYSQVLNKYVVKDAPAGDLEKLFLDPSSRYVNGPYSLYSILPSLAGKDPYGSIMIGVKKVDYVGVEDVDGIQCHHMRFTQDRFSWDLWVDAGKNPWVVKVTPDLFSDLANTAPKSLSRVIPKSTKMSLTFRYKEWIANPTIKKTYFNFVPPPESTETKSFTGDSDDKSEAKSGEKANDLVGTAAPNFSLKLSDGGEMDLSKHKGKDVVVLDFWATWCGPCRMSLPILNKVTKAFSDKHVVFYPVNIAEDTDKVKEFLKDQDLDVVAAMDTEKKASEMYHANGIPETVIIDKKGVVRFLHVGYSSDLEKELTNDLNSLVQ
ncbi:MAG TPA: redoxin family protein [Drouetiella sp.]